MKKVLLTSICMVASLTWGGNVDAQTTTTTSVTFTPSSDKKTLTISGQGDLTQYSAVSDELKFTSTGCENVKPNNDNGIWSNPVGVGAIYNSSTTYYATYPKKIASLYPDYASAESVTTSWNEAKLESGLYYYGQNTTTGNWEWMKVQDSDAIHAADNDCEWVDHKKYSNYSTTAGEDGRILFDTFKNDYVITTLSGVTFIDKQKQYLYVLSNNKYVQLAADAEYDANETYYYWDASSQDLTKVNFGAISEDEMIKLGYLEYPTENLAQILNYKLSSSDNTYTTIKFVNEGSDALTINDDIVKALLYPATATTATANSVLTTLDLGAATCTNLSSQTFAQGQAAGTLKLETLTLPLTNKTEVYSESESKSVDKMIVPTEVITLLTPNPTTVIIPEGYDRIAKCGFSQILSGQYVGNSIKNVILPTSLSLIGESAFQNCTQLTSIEFKEGLENIGKNAFNGTGLTSVSFPSSLKMINDGAFCNCRMFNFKFNAGLKYIGNGAFALSSHDEKKDEIEKTLEIPASVRYIGAFAFCNRTYQDVYFYGERAPMMPLGSYENWGEATAFDSKLLMGNSGFNEGKDWQKKHAEGVETIYDDAWSQGYANRENYKNNGGIYFCMLHFPNGLTDDQRAAYTDITRDYKTVEEGQQFYFGINEYNPYSYLDPGKEEETLSFGDYTANKRVSLGYQDTYLGRQYIWPSQDQWTRSYVVNSNGYNWNGKDTYRPTLDEGDLAILAYAGYKVGTGEGEYTLDELKKIAHMGTRQFVLANADVNVDREETKAPEYPINIKGEEWWTICVPFNMTKKQVDDVFGEGTHVCRFNKVERLVNRTTQEKAIKLYFTNDVYVHKSTKDDKGNYTTSQEETTADGDVVIYAHESYMIYPKNSSEDANKMYNIKDYKLEVGSPLPTIVKANEAYTKDPGQMADKDDNEWNQYYRFVGNYQTTVAASQSASVQANDNVATMSMNTVYVPQYSYIYAQKKNTPRAQFWFFTGTDMPWGANKCVVQATAKDGGKSDYENYFGGDLSASAKKATEMSFFGMDDHTTGVENIEIIAGDAENSQVIYNLNGQLVSKNGNMNGLQRGVYVKNGKKYMVK